MYLRRSELQLVVLLAFVAAAVGQFDTPVFRGPPRCFRPVDLCFLLDSSGTIGEQNWQRTINFVIDVVRSLDIRPEASRIGVSHFADNVYLSIAGGDYSGFNDLQNKINAIRFVNGRTRTSSALVHTATQCFQQPRIINGRMVMRMAIFLSDGRPNPFDEDELQRAIALYHSVVNVSITVATSNEIDIMTLIRIAKRSDGLPLMAGRDYFPYTDITGLTGGLTSYLPDIIPEICQSQRPPPIIQRRCTEKLDICLVMDRSGSVTPGGWGLAQQIARGLINEFLLLPDFVQVAVLSFASDAQVHTALGSTTDNEQLINMINMRQYIGSPSALGRALSFASSNCFPGGRDRPDANNIVVLFTSGISTEDPRIVEQGKQLLHGVGVANKVTVIGIDNFNPNLLSSLSKSVRNRVPRSDEDYFPSTTITNIPRVVSQVISSTCRSLPTCRRPVDLCFVLDSSESVRSSGWETVKRFVLDIVARLNIEPTEANVGIVVFSNDASLVVPMQQGQDLRQLTDLIRGLPYRNQDTATGEALRLTANACFPRNRRRDPSDPLVIIPKVALVLTDGIPTIPRFPPGAAMRDLQAGIAALKNTADVIGVIGVGPELGSNLGQETLRRIAKAREPGTAPREGVNYFLTPNFQGLTNLLDDVIPEICAEPPVVTRCEKQLDVCFIVDSSSSVTNKGWEKARLLVQRLAQSLTMTDNRAARIGVVQFSRQALHAIRLAQYSNKDDLIERIAQLPYLNGWTNTSGALRMAARECFSQFNNRANRPQVAIVITDGQPNIEIAFLPDAIRELHDSSDLVVALGVSNDIDEQMLRSITKTWSGQAARAGQDFFQCQDINEVDMVLGTIVDLICADQRPAPTCRRTADICFMLDRSGSETFQGYQMIQETAISLIQTIITNLPDIPNIGIISFSDYADNDVPLGRYTATELQNRIQNIHFLDGYTNIANTLNLTAYGCFGTRNDRRGVRNVAIFIGDGVSTLRFEGVPPATNNLKRVADCVLAIGIGRESNPIALANISKPPASENRVFPVRGEDYFVENDVRDIPFIAQRVIKKICPQSIPQPPINTCRQTADFCFMLDRSGSETMVGWNKIQRTTTQLITILDSTLREKAHFGVLSFSDDAIKHRDLGPIDRNSLSEINRIPWADGFTDISSTLRLAATQCFTTTNDRNGVKNVGIFLSDGVSTKDELRQLEQNTILIKSDSITNFIVGIAIGIESDDRAVINITKKQFGGSPVLNQDYFKDTFQQPINVQAIADEIIRKLCENPPPGVSPPVRPPVSPPRPPVPAPVPAPVPPPTSYTCGRTVDLCVVVANTALYQGALYQGQEHILNFFERALDAYIVNGQSTFGLVSYGLNQYTQIYNERTSRQGVNFIRDTQTARSNGNNPFFSNAMGLTGAWQCFFNTPRQNPNALIYITGGGRDMSQSQQIQTLIQRLKSVTNIIVPVGIGGESEFVNLFESLAQNYEIPFGERPRIQRDYYIFANYQALLRGASSILSKTCILPAPL